MGAVPKRKISKARRDRRRAHDHLKAPAMSICPKCKAVKRPHFKCSNCGHYGEVEASKAKARTQKPSKKSAQKSQSKTKTKGKSKKS